MKLLPKLPKENARSYAIRVLMYNIQTLQLPPGSSISENELSAALSLSPAPPFARRSLSCPAWTWWRSFLSGEAM